jgi:hypothetical protein
VAEQGWEYLVVDLVDYQINENQRLLNELGSAGWELVAVNQPAYAKSRFIVVYLKRAIT